MTPIQAVRIPLASRSQLGPLRTLRGLEVREDGDAIWLRVTEASDELQIALQSLPAATAYRVLEDGQLCRVGSRVPRGFLPEGPWQSLSRLFHVEQPHTVLPALICKRIPLQLARDAQPRDANILLTSFENWLAYGSTAPQIRLGRWHFAVSTNREVLVRGLPLPPIPGRQFVEEQGIAVPCGWRWSPAVDVDVLARAFSLSDRDMLLWRDDGRTEHIAADDFVRATRSAIRLSLEESHD